MKSIISKLKVAYKDEDKIRYFGVLVNNKKESKEAQDIFFKNDIPWSAGGKRYFDFDVSPSSKAIIYYSQWQDELLQRNQFCLTYEDGIRDLCSIDKRDRECLISIKQLKAMVNNNNMEIE